MVNLIAYAKFYINVISSFLLLSYDANSRYRYLKFIQPLTDSFLYNVYFTYCVTCIMCSFSTSRLVKFLMLQLFYNMFYQIGCALVLFPLILQ